MTYHVRWMVRRDLPQVLAIEAEAFEFPWDEADFLRSLRQRNCIGMVCEDSDGVVVGFMLYEMHKGRLRVPNIAVRESHRRRGVGREMIFKMTAKLSPEPGKRNRLMVEVRETNLDAQLFFRALGFRAISVLRDFYEDTDEDAYLMQYRVPAPKSVEV